MPKTPSKFTHPTFLAMKKIWYEKLKQNNFNDIERGNANGYIKRDDIFERPERYKPLKPEADTLNHQFLYTHEFSSDEERDLWERYTKGGGAVGKHPTLNKEAVHYRMKKLKRAFREWKRKECEEASNLVSIDNVVLIRELEVESANRALEGYSAMKATSEVYRGGKWRKVRGGGES